MLEAGVYAVPEVGSPGEVPKGFPPHTAISRSSVCVLAGSVNVMLANGVAMSVAAVSAVAETNEIAMISSCI